MRFRSLLSLPLVLALAACANNANVTVNIAAVTGTDSFVCVNVPADSTRPCGGATWSAPRYDPLQLIATGPGSADGQVLEIELPSRTSNASACLVHSSGGIGLSSNRTIECADSGTITLSVWPTAGASPFPRGTTHLHFPDGATIDATFTVL